jgi:hypothetical protein
VPKFAEVANALRPQVAGPRRGDSKNESLRVWPIFFREAGIRQFELWSFVLLEDEHEAQVNHSTGRVETSRSRHGKKLLVPIPGGKPLCEQNLRERFSAKVFQEFCRDAMREPVRAQFRIENLSERNGFLSIARQSVILLTPIREDPIDTHGDHAFSWRFAVSWNAE